MHLIDYINSYEDWEERLARPPYNLEVKTKGEYKLLKYKMSESNFDYTEVQEARGCIVTQNFDGEWIYVCRPFKKFFNYGERWAAHIDWSYTFITEKIDGCFTGSDRVLLANGTSREIKHIVNNKEKVEVLTYNFDTGRLEPKKVCGWKKSDKPSSIEEWRTISLRKVKTTLNGKLSQHCIITPTYNHLFYRKGENNKIEEVEAKYLKEGDILFTSKYDLTAIEKQVCLGTLLGDGSCNSYQEDSISREKSIRFSHSRKQKDYVNFKASLLEKLGGKVKDILVKGSFNPEKTIYSTNVHSGITSVYDICYTKYHKYVTKEWLDSLNWLGFAIWYMDDGCLDKAQKNNSLSLHTEGFSIEENELIHNYYEDKGFHNYIRDDKKGHFFIHFSTEASELIWQNIRMYIPECMQYKLPARHQNYYIPIIDNEERHLQLVEGYIEHIEEGLKAHNPYKAKAVYRYDIEVEDNHNYFCQGVLVHNSLMKMWFHSGRWHLSTNGTIDAFNAPINESKYTFGQIFEYILGTDISSFAEECDLNPNFTYLFEMVSPETRVVIPYNYKIYYLTRFKNSNGAEVLEVLLLTQQKLKLSQFVDFPQVYNFDSLEEVIAEAEKLDSLHEGFVITDAYSNRVKVKSPEYLRAAHLFAKGYIGKIDMLEMLLNNSVDDFLGYFPEYLQMVLEVRYDIMGLCNKLNACWDLYGGLLSRKEFALKVKNLAGAPLLFMKYTDPKLNFYTYIWTMDYKKLARILGYKEEK